MTQQDVGFAVIDRSKTPNMRCKAGEGEEHAVTCFRKDFGRFGCDGRCAR